MGDGIMPTGSSLFARAEQHLGERYQHAVVPKDKADYRGPWDCAEFASWLVYQEAEKLYGCRDNAASPATADAYTGYWKRDARGLGRMIPVEQAAASGPIGRVWRSSASRPGSRRPACRPSANPCSGKRRSRSSSPSSPMSGVPELEPRPGPRRAS